MNAQEMTNEFKFSMLEGKIDYRILKSLSSMGLENPTLIQAKTLPYMLLGEDIIGAAKTGSGKTLAFLIPAIDKLINLGFTKNKGVGCLIISPTRELALQTNEVLKKLLSDIKLTHSLIVGGEKKMKEIMLLQKGINIIVGTPGRVLDHLQNTENFNCKNLKCLILDEADKLLEAGFEKEIVGIIKRLPKNRQTVLFSATIDDRVERLARITLKSNPKVIDIKDDKQSTVVGLQQGYCICPVENRICWLYKMLKKTRKKKVMVFFSSCKSVDFHYELFKTHCKASVLSIHGKQSQPRRKDAYQTFIKADKGALFCTDVAARGLDIPLVDWIVQYDPPTDMKEYIHRVGRTARGLNSNGNAVILIRPEEEEFIQYLKREKVYLDKYNFGDTPSDVQKMLEELIKQDGTMKVLARKAYLSFLRCYNKHPLSKVFNIKNLNLKMAAKAFGFIEQPHVDFLKSRKDNI
ncbi:ATP-dependent RNA helicase DDX18-like [Vanessa cardui]|uniref:ATP-dependent RNA helicase DDX18-like n=1 Tax=Vanessa cardui TaxID=171605 RepID=UPI001F12F432|nr:ATP-dependent RNA helicase DDX18-like [Vanessa cardui]